MYDLNNRLAALTSSQRKVAPSILSDPVLQSSSQISSLKSQQSNIHNFKDTVEHNTQTKLNTEIIIFGSDTLDRARRHFPNSPNSVSQKQRVHKGDIKFQPVKVTSADVAALAVPAEVDEGHDGTQNLAFYERTNVSIISIAIDNIEDKISTKFEHPFEAEQPEQAQRAYKGDIEYEPVKNIAADVAALAVPAEFNQELLPHMDENDNVDA